MEIVSESDSDELVVFVDMASLAHDVLRLVAADVFSENIRYV